MAAAIAAHIAWILAIRASGLDPVDAPVLRGVVLYGPGLVTAGLALAIALRTGLFTASELGLRRQPWAPLIGLFFAGTIIEIAGPLGTMVASGMNYDEIVAHLFRHEFRYMYSVQALPLTAWDIGVRAVKSLVLVPLTEEIPYRSLFMPVVLTWMSRSWSAGASGLVFFLVHWIAFGGAPHPAYFLHGFGFAWAFLWAGLPGAVAAHAGVSLGVIALATFAAFAHT
jgi:membrane protease YdiL (CAAX protease family)